MDFYSILGSRMLSRINGAARPNGRWEFHKLLSLQLLSKIPPKTPARHNGMTDGYLPNLKGKMKAVQLMDGSMDEWTMADRSSG